LKDNGFEVVTASDGASGLAKAKAERPDMITLDITMPGKSGVDVYKDIRSNPTTNTIPIFVITGMVDFRQLMYQKTVQAPEGFIKKPVDQDVLLMTINRILGKKEKTDHRTPN